MLIYGCCGLGTWELSVPYPTLIGALSGSITNGVVPSLIDDAAQTLNAGCHCPPGPWFGRVIISLFFDSKIHRHSQTNCFSSRHICKNCLGFPDRRWSNQGCSGRETAWRITPLKKKTMISLANQEHQKQGMRTSGYIGDSQNSATCLSRETAVMETLHYLPSGTQFHRENKHFPENSHSIFLLGPIISPHTPSPVYI